MGRSQTLKARAEVVGRTRPPEVCGGACSAPSCFLGARGVVGLGATGPAAGASLLVRGPARSGAGEGAGAGDVEAGLHHAAGGSPSSSS